MTARLSTSGDKTHNNVQSQVLIPSFPNVAHGQSVPSSYKNQVQSQTNCKWFDFWGCSVKAVDLSRTYTRLQQMRMGVWKYPAVIVLKFIQISSSGSLLRPFWSKRSYCSRRIDVWIGVSDWFSRDHTVFSFTRRQIDFNLSIVHLSIQFFPLPIYSLWSGSCIIRKSLSISLALFLSLTVARSAFRL